MMFFEDMVTELHTRGPDDVETRPRPIVGFHTLTTTHNHTMACSATKIDTQQPRCMLPNTGSTARSTLKAG
jgi:hypothetical protein